MNLFFRLIALVIRDAFFASRIGYLDPATLSFRVWITDQDAFQHMNNSRYMSIADLAVVDLLMRTGFAKSLRQNGFTPVVVHKDLSVFKMLKFPQRYEVTSRIVGWQGPYVCFQHDFYRNGRRHAASMTIGRMVGRNGEKPRVDALAERLGWGEIPSEDSLPDAYAARIRLLEAARQAARAAADQ